MHIIHSLIDCYKITFIAHKHELFRRIRMIFDNVIFIVGALNALECAAWTLIFHVFAVVHFMSTKCIVIVRIIVTFIAIESLIAKMTEMMVSQCMFTIECLGADVTLQCKRLTLMFHCFVVRKIVLFQMFCTVERLATVFALADCRRRRSSVNAPMILHLTRVFKRLWAIVALEISAIRMDFHVGVF